MPTWILYALIATFFAGLTSVLAKFGIQKINSDLGLAIRTAVVLLIVTTNVLYWRGTRDLSQLTPKTTGFLLLSGVTTSLSWIFYYRAMKLGTVSFVAAIDKGSILITLLLSVVLLGEPLTFRLLLGAGFMLMGMLILIWK